MIWWFLAAAAAALPLALAARAYWRSQRAQREWQLLLSSEAEKAVEDSRAFSEVRHTLIEVMLDAADDAWNDGDENRARELLESGASTIERSAKSFMEALQMAKRLAIMVSASVPVPSLRPKAFRLWETRRLAAVAAFVTLFLQTAGEQLRLRVMVLGAILRVIVHVAVRSRSHLKADAQLQPQRTTLRAAAADTRTVTNETMETTRLALLALEHEALRRGCSPPPSER